MIHNNVYNNNQMKVIKAYVLYLYIDGYMTSKKAERSLRGHKVFFSKPKNKDIENYIQEMLDSGELKDLKGLKIRVDKDYDIEI